MNVFEIVFFGVCSLLVLGGGIVTVASLSPIRGAMGLLGTIVGIAGMYLGLYAEFLAAVQILVYAGAVVVLFLFVIMLLGPSATAPRDARTAVSRYLGAGVFAVSAASALFVMYRSLGGERPKLPPPTAGLGTIESVGKEMFSADVVPFEVSGALLIVAVVGAVAVARGKQRDPTTDAAAGALPAKTRAGELGAPQGAVEAGSGSHAVAHGQEAAS